MVVEKKVISLEYFCDLCGKQIEGKVYSPVWGELDQDGDGNYDRDGDIINVDICSYCVKKADRMIVDLFTGNRQAESNEEVKQEVSEIQVKADESREEATETEPELVRELALELAQMEENEAPRPRRGGRAIKIDIFKVMELHNAGWSNGKIAKELGVSAATIQRRVNEVLKAEESDNK